VKRGEIWTVAAGSGFGGKPRPCVIVQDDAYALIDSVTVALCTSGLVEADFRIALEPTDRSGLAVPTSVMIDKIVTVPRTKLGSRLGILTPAELTELNRALLLFLGIAASIAT